MTRPRLLDLFCGAGGCSVGYQRAGFDVVGVDVITQPNYPFEFHQFDAMTYPLDGFDAVHASPPCHDHSSLRHTMGHAKGTAWMLAATKDRLVCSGLPWVIENVESAEMPGSLVLCGSEFGLGAMCHDGVWRQLRRHRKFDSNTFFMGAGGCNHKGEALGVYGEGSGRSRAKGRRGGYQGRRAERIEAMGIDWMPRGPLAQAIPPAYTEFIGAQLIDHLARAAA